MATPLNLIKGDRVASNVDYRDALPVNMTAILKPVLGAAGYMLQDPGLTQFGTSIGLDRGANFNERFDIHFRVSGTKLCSISSTGVSTTLGDVSGSDTVSMPYSFNTQGVISNGRFSLFSIWRIQ
jgi:hypothetical protein